MIKGNPHNQRLTEALSAIKTQVVSAQNDGDLVKAINSLSGFPTPVRYNNRNAHYVGAGATMSGALVAMYGFLNPATSPDWLLPIGATTASLSLIIYGLFLWKRRSSLSSLSDQIHRKTILFDNHLEEIPIGGKLAARRLGLEFADFNRGNHSREIRYALKGRHKGSEHSFEYRYYHFHYVNRRVETYTTTVNGKTRVRTRTVYDHYDRYAFVLPFGFARDISIVRERNKHMGKQWETASIDFNKRFGVFAASEIEAAKFLTPKVILTIEALSAHYHTLNLEFNAVGDLCLFFQNADILQRERAYDLTQPSVFAREIAGHTSLEKLRITLDSVHTLMKYSDSNF